jgi:hypothetical protein
VTIDDDAADLDALYHRLYMQLKDGTVDPEVAFDLACHVLSDQPFAEDATELARLRLEDGVESRIEAAVRDFLSGSLRRGLEPLQQPRPRLPPGVGE